MEEDAVRKEDTPYKIIEANAISNEVRKLFYDDASRMEFKGKTVAGVEIVFVFPQNHIISQACSLIKSYSNNIAKYNALLISLKIARQLGVNYIEVYGDFQLIVNQVKGEYKIKNKNHTSYYQAVTKIIDSFDGFYSHVPRYKITMQIYSLLWQLTWLCLKILASA